MIKNVAIILAAGSGNRLGGEIPKQFMTIAGKQVIEHSIDAFESHTLIDEICVITRADYVQTVKELVARNNYRKVKNVLPGGKERYDSTLAAIDAYADEQTNLLFHDAVRPLVSERIITDCIQALQHYDAVAVAAKTTDTILSVDCNDCIEFIPARDALRNAQTPQCFKLGTIRQAYRRALTDPGFTTTDDCGTVKKYMPEVPIYVVPGDAYNMKLTYKEDLQILEQLFMLRYRQNKQ